MPAYGGTISERNSNSVLSLFLDHPAEKRLRAIVNFVQYGIDLGYIARHSGPYMWAPEGGHGTGRPVPMLFAGLLLNSQEILDGTKFAGPMRFSEWGAVNYRANAGQPLWGQVTEVFSITEPRELSYWHGLIRDLVNHSAIEDPYGYIDGGTRPGDYYQNWIINEKGSALAVHLLQHYSFPETLTNFNNDTYLTFMDRWVQFGAVTSPDVCAPPEGVWLAGPQMGTHCTTAEESATPLWARTIQDECGFGVCFDGPFTGQPCGPFFGPGTASTSTRCGKDGNNVEYRCALNSQHGVTYGYQGTGSCIADVDPSDGIGRFPQFHGFNRDGTAVAVPGFKDEMWATYRAQASH
jgi:hypothetical protein